MSNHGMKPRKSAGDEFYTPKEAVDDLIEFLRNDWNLSLMNFWCPADDEKSAIVKGLSEEDATVYFTTLKTGYDFTDKQIWPNMWNGEIDMIVTNPPFSLKDEFLERCIEIGKPFALLLPDTLFDSKKRVKLLEKLKEDLFLLVPDHRYRYYDEKWKLQDHPIFKSIWVIGNMHHKSFHDQITFCHKKGTN